MKASTPAGSYRVLRGACSGELREKGSKFLALLKPVPDAREADRYRGEVEKRHRDATHHCWVERIGWPAVEHSSDGGEPRGTAGEPIVRVLRSNELSDVVAVVARWFGGVKLGKGGLARAYAQAVTRALESGTFELRFPMSRLRLRMAYDQVGAVKRLARSRRAQWIAESYGVEVEATLAVRRDREEAVRLALADLRVEVLAETEDRS